MSFDPGDPKTGSAKPDPRKRAHALRQEAADYLRALRAERVAKRRAPLSDRAAGQESGPETSADCPADLPHQDDPQTTPAEQVKVFERWQPSGSISRGECADNGNRASAQTRRRETIERRAAVRDALVRSGEARRGALRNADAAGTSDPVENGTRPLRRGPRTARMLADSRTEMAQRLVLSGSQDVDDDAVGSVFGELMKQDAAPGDHPAAMVPDTTSVPPSSVLVNPEPAHPEPANPVPANPVPASPISEGPDHGSGVWVNHAAFQTVDRTSAEDPCHSAEAGEGQMADNDAQADPAEEPANTGIPDLKESLQVRAVRTPVPLDALPIIGAGMRARLHQLDIRTVQDLSQADPVALKAALGNLSCLANVDAWVETARIFVHGSGGLADGAV